MQTITLIGNPTIALTEDFPPEVLDALISMVATGTPRFVVVEVGNTSVTLFPHSVLCIETHKHKDQGNVDNIF